jgi:sirohydrochlorin ferrochelatase
VNELVVCSHGTRSVLGAERISGLVAAVHAALPSVVVREAHVDVHPPFLDDVLTPGAVVVPLLLAPGYHVHVDIAQAAHRVGAHVTPALGPDALLTSVLRSRLSSLGLEEGDRVVLAAAGSSVPGSDRATRAAARSLAGALGRPVQVAYGAAGTPRLDELVARLHASSAPERRVVAASYLLAPGHFHDRVLASGADAVTDPLLDGGAPDPRLVELVVRRYRERSFAEAV